MERWNGMRSCRNTAGAAAMLAVMLISIPGAQAAVSPPGGSRPLAVSVPSEAAPLGPGATGTIPIRIANPGPVRVTVRISGHGVHFGDQGRVAITGGDPMWDGRVEFPASPITISAESFRDVGLMVHMPARISPDLYFIGFLVTPLPAASGNINYVNQIGSYVTIDVPGPRTRKLVADLHLPGFALTSHVHGQLHVHNVGTAAAMFWGENDTTATPGSSSPRQGRFARSFLPTARSRTIVVDAKPSFLVSIVTMHVRIIYPGRTEAATREIVLTRRILVIQPAALVLLGALLVIVGIWFARRRRKRRPPSPRHRGPVNAGVAARVDRRLAGARANAKPTAGTSRR
jgi:LPXTG-motif cell wall-anchored protein